MEIEKEEAKRLRNEAYELEEKGAAAICMELDKITFFTDDIPSAGISSAIFAILVKELDKEVSELTLGELQALADKANTIVYKDEALKRIAERKEHYESRQQQHLDLIDWKMSNKP